MKARVISGEAVLGVFDLREGGYVVGSSPEAHLHIDSPSVASRHVRLKVGTNQLVVEDLGSGHGTFVNGTPVVGSQSVAAGSKIGLGTVLIEILEEEETASGARYEVGEVVAQGAMGVIRRARETSTGREVAMKQMHEELAARDAGLAVRFVQEARITAHLEHPNIVPVHDVSPGAEEERFYTMKMVRGVSLEEIIEQLATRSESAVGAYPLETLLTIFQKVCDALAFAHSKGVIHRDLKPANIMVGEYGEVLVMDWGLAKLVGEAAADLVDGNPEVFARAGAEMTLAGTVMGTPHYMAPEQAASDGEMVDERSDVYALGAILYRALTLRTPIEGESTEEVLAKARQGRIVSPIERVGAELLPHLPGGHIPASLAAVAMKALALAPGRRYQSVPELQAEIRAYQSGFATSAEGAGALRQFALLIKRHRGVAAAVAAGLVLLATGAAISARIIVQEKNLAQDLQKLAEESAAGARISEKKENQARLEAEANARLAAQRLDEVNETAAREKREAEARRTAEESVKIERKGKLLAETKTVQTQVELEMEKNTSQAAKKEAQQASLAKTAAEVNAEQAGKTKASERIAKLGDETHAAALRGDAGTVLLNSVFLLGRETDQKQIVLHQRRIGAALRRMPRLLYLVDGAHQGRVSRDGNRAVFFAGDQGTLFDPASLQKIGPSLDHGPNGWVEAVEFGRDSDYLLSAGSTSNAPRRIDPLRRQVTGQFFSAGSTTADQPKVWVWSAVDGSRVMVPERGLEGNLEGFLPYPDRLRIVTVHGGSKTRNRQVTLWTMTGRPGALGESLPASAGYLAGLIPGTERSRFFVQSFAPGTGERNGAIRQLDLSTTTLRISAPLRVSLLEGAAAISPDGERAVRLVNRQLRFAEAPPPDASGRSLGPQVVAYLKDGTGSGTPLSALPGEPQELINTTTGKVLGRILHGGASTFSPDSAWLLMADEEKTSLHPTLNNNPESESTDELSGKVTSLAFSGDSSKAIVVRAGARVSILQTGNGRRSCPDLLLPAEVAEVSTSVSARLVMVSGGGVSLWETALPERRPRVNFRALSPYAVWVSGDGRWAVSIPPSTIPTVAPGTGMLVVTQPADGASTGKLMLHDLNAPQKRGNELARLNELPNGGTCWLTRNGRFFLTWGGGGGAKCWDLQKKSKDRNLIAVNEQNHRPKKYEYFYNGRRVVVAEGPQDVFGLVIEGGRPDDKVLTAVFRDGARDKAFPEDTVPADIVVKDTAGLRRVADLDGKQTLARAAKALEKELPPDARRAFFSDGEKLVAVLCTSPNERAMKEPVLSELLFQSDGVGKTTEELDREGRHYGFTPPVGRAWRLHVYDVAAGAALLGDMPLPGLTAFRWEGERCVALSNIGEWTEIDFSPDRRPIEDLRHVSLVLTGRAIDPDTGEVAMNAQPISTLVRHRQQLLQKYSAGWQTGTK